MVDERDDDEIIADMNEAASRIDPDAKPLQEVTDFDGECDCKSLQSKLDTMFDVVRAYERQLRKAEAKLERQKVAHDEHVDVLIDLVRSVRDELRAAAKREKLVIGGDWLQRADEVIATHSKGT